MESGQVGTLERYVECPVSGRLECLRRSSRPDRFTRSTGRESKDAPQPTVHYRSADPVVVAVWGTMGQGRTGTVAGSAAIEYVSNRDTSTERAAGLRTILRDVYGAQTSSQRGV